MAEYGDPATFRHMTLSKSACDFRPDATVPGATGPFAVSYGNTVTIDFNVGAPPISLVPGQTYYINFRNYSPDIGASCFGGTLQRGTS